MALTRTPSWEAILIVGGLIVASSAASWGHGFWTATNLATTGARLDQLEKRVGQLEARGR